MKRQQSKGTQRTFHLNYQMPTMNPNISRRLWSSTSKSLTLRTEEVATLKQTLAHNNQIKTRLVAFVSPNSIRPVKQMQRHTTRSTTTALKVNTQSKQVNGSLT